MAGAISTLFVEIRASTTEFSKDMNGAVRDLRAFDKDTKSLTSTLDGLGRGFTQAGGMLTLGLTAPIIAMGAAAVVQFNEAAKATALMENAIRSTGDASGKSAIELHKLATSLQGNSIFDDDRIMQSVIVQMLTFTKVTGEAFDRGSQAALNMATVLGEDLQSASIQVGKALNDPVAGVTALQRVGVKLTEDQKALVKSFMDVNDIAGAQGVILKELETEFGGASKAASEVGSGPMTQLTVKIGNLSESWGGLIQEQLKPFIGIASGVVDKLDTMSDSTKVAVLAVSGLAAGVGPVFLGLGQLSFAVSNLITIIPRLQTAIAYLGTSGIAAAAGVTALGAALGIGIGMLINYLIEGTKLQKWLDEFTSSLVGLVHTYDSTKQAAESAAFTNKAVANGVVDLTSKVKDQTSAITGAVSSFAELVEKHKDVAKATTGTTETMKHLNAEMSTMGANDAWKVFQADTSEADKLLKKFDDITIKKYLDDIKKIGEEWQKSADIATLAAQGAVDQTEFASKAAADATKAAGENMKTVTDEMAANTKRTVEGTLKAASDQQKAYDDLFKSVQKTASDTFVQMFKDGKFHFSALKDTIDGIFKTLWTKLLSDMTATFLTPMISKLEGILGIGGSGGGGLFGGILAKIGLGGGTAAAGAATAGGGAAAGTAGAGGGLGGSMGALLTNPWTAVVAGGILGVTAWIKSQAHHEANTLTQNVENPFWSAWGKILPSDQAGTLEKLDPEQAAGILANLKEMNANYLDLVKQFSVKGSDELKVSQQSLANTQGHVADVTAALERAIAAGAASATDKAADSASIIANYADDIAGTWSDMMTSVTSGLKSAVLSVNETMQGLIESFSIDPASGTAQQVADGSFNWGNALVDTPFGFTKVPRIETDSSRQLVTPDLTTNAMGGSNNQVVAMLQAIHEAILGGQVIAVDGNELTAALRAPMYAQSASGSKFIAVTA